MNDYSDLPDLSKEELAMYDRIDSFILGEMSKDEEQQFLSDCKKDKDLRDRAKAVALLVKTIKDHAI